MTLTGVAGAVLAARAVLKAPGRVSAGPGDLHELEDAYVIG